MAQQQLTKLQLLRLISVLSEEMKGTAIAAEAEVIMKKKLHQVTRDQLVDLKQRMDEEFKKSFILKGIQ